MGEHEGRARARLTSGPKKKGERYSSDSSSEYEWEDGKPVSAASVRALCSGGVRGSRGGRGALWW